jgi:hypothetical protein
MMQHLFTAFKSIAIVSISFACGITQADVDSHPIHLDAPVGMLKASGTSLSDVINQIQVSSGDPILVNWAALKQAHITENLPVTIDISNLPVNKALTQLLDTVGGSHIKLAYTTDNNAIIITTAAELSKNVVTRVYDIHAAFKNDSSHASTLDSITRRVRGLDPLSWRDAGGGDYGSISEYNGQLIITQTPELQTRIAAEIKDIVSAIK